MSKFPTPPKHCPICASVLVPYPSAFGLFKGDHCPFQCFGAYWEENGKAASKGKLIFWCIDGLGLNGEEMTPDEFDRWMKLQAFR